MRRGLRSNCLGACLNQNDTGLLAAASCVYMRVCMRVWPESLMVDVHCALWTQLHDQQTSLQIKGGQTMIFFSKPQTTLQTGESKLT